MLRLIYLCVFLLGLAGTVQAQSKPLCVDSDGDGWGWNGVTTCFIQNCIDSDGDGWGWDGAMSCRTIATVPLTACIDIDGDGWGWNGRKSCLVLDDCVDSDGDGWGWNTTGTCLPDVGDSSIQRISKFGLIDGVGFVRYLDGQYYARINASDYSSSVWRLTSDAEPTRVSGPAAIVLPEPIKMSAFDDSLVWMELTPLGNLVAKRLDRSGVVSEICTNGISEAGGCEDSIIGDIAFTAATENTLSFYSFGLSPAAILNKGQNVTRPVLSPAGEEIYIFGGPTELDGRIFFSGYTDSDTNYRVWSADLNLENTTEITGPDGIGVRSYGGGYTTRNKYVGYQNRTNDDITSPTLLFADNSSDVMKAVSITTDSYIQIIGATDSRVFITKGEENSLYSISDSDGSEINHFLNNALQAFVELPATYEDTLFFVVCENTNPCSGRSLYLTLDDGMSVKKISDNTGTRIALKDGEVFYSKNNQLYRADTVGNSTLVGTGAVQVERVLNSDDHGVYFIGVHPLDGVQIYVHR